MAIKNKDGTKFVLNKPNPIMKEQDFWDQYKLHNFKYNDFVTQGVEKYEDLTEIKPEEIKVKEEITKNIEKIFCLPAIINERKDSLYGEIRTSIGYGQQFTLEAVIMDSNDISISIWTNVDIEKGSILFAPKNRRWWKVDHKDEQGLLKCSPSEIHPSFG